jgi:hypothetical protein
MSNRLNLIFHYDSSNIPYCLLAVRDFAADDDLLLPRLLTSLLASIENQTRSRNPCISALAADVVKVMASQGRAYLLPPNSDWRAVLTISIRQVQREFRLACKTLDFGELGATIAEKPAINDSPLEMLNGFEGNVRQLQQVVEQVKWTDLNMQ